MKFLEKHPMIMIVIGIIGISLSAIFVKYSEAPSVVTAAYRLLWTVPMVPASGTEVFGGVKSEKAKKHGSCRANLVQRREPEECTL